MRATFGKGATKSATASSPAVALGALEQVVILADRAQIPLIGGGLGVVVELIKSFQTASANRSALESLLQGISTRSSHIWQFVQAMEPDYLRESDEIGAVLAREAMCTFGRELDEIRAVILGYSIMGTPQRLALASSIKAELANWEKRLYDANQSFTTAQVNVALSLLRASKPAGDELTILGAVPLRACDLDVASLRHEKQAGAPSGGTAVMIADVRNQKRLVKLYHAHVGGENTFLRDLHFYGQRTYPNVMAVQGYCRASSVSFIVFSSGPSSHLVDYLQEMAGVWEDSAVAMALRIMFSVFDATMFLCGYNDEGRLTVPDGVKIIKEARMDENGQPLLFPELRTSLPNFHPVVSSSPRALAIHIMDAVWPKLFYRGGPMKCMRSLNNIRFYDWGRIVEGAVMPLDMTSRPGNWKDIWNADKQAQQEAAAEWAHAFRTTPTKGSWEQAFL